MSKSRLLLSFASVFASAALIIGATVAFFSDTETSADNLLQAGKIDLKIDNESYYNGAFNTGTSWSLADLDDGNGPSSPEGAYLFFNFNDIKPSDHGEDTISLHVYDNSCWICAEVKLTSNDDNGSTEPELVDEDPYTDGAGNGELAAKVNFLWWADDGDNVLEDDETPLPAGPIGALAVGETAKVTLADSQFNIWSPGPSPSPFPGGEDRFIGKAWCFGAITPQPLGQDGFGDAINPSLDNNGDQTVNSADGGFLCNGSAENNETQTDSLTLDVTFKAIQARNNPNFKCNDVQGSPTPTPTGSPAPCEQPDVMLVLDRSGSINSTELAQLKTAAKDFVDDLNPTLLGAHVGFSSFSTTASLNHHLSENGASVKTAIDLLTSSGLTNLFGGINLAKNEQANPGDGHDRPDLTSPDIMIIITDGNPNEPGTDTNARNVAAAEADSARTAGAEIFVVGVGGDVDATYLQTEIADDAAHYYSVSDYSQLSTILTGIADCPQ